ncbi:GH25 family lysozyme [Actinoplanes sp. L3-i22]|uniref:GH25 family lysozyme n=1 Tax=Actinoplanes sp. L3-i22 TaxID=2836373 RepID=UPI001C74D3A2|nr:GH25 family lysozyme [Actinoplanes sp. L3-i22]BCY13640.1 hypothetical protein L3i22_087280 [Actinoplanes sp. L3-i22]
MRSIRRLHAALVALAAGVTLFPAVPALAAPAGPPGLDVSGWQSGDNFWPRVFQQGGRFAYVKATEGLSSRTNPNFARQYNGAYQAGLIRGAYHFAIPSPTSGGARQADFFVDHGGGWSRDGRTLPGAVDLEGYPGRPDQCYGMRGTPMVNWIRDFSNRYQARTGRRPVIYTRTNWWNTCTGRSTAFGSTSPLWLAEFGVRKPSSVPAGWSTYSFWQWSDKQTPFPGDQDVWNGPADRLRVMACGGPC